MTWHIWPPVGDARHTVRDHGLPPRDGEEELVLHPDVHGHEDEICDQVVDEAQSEANTDVVERNAERGKQVEDGQLRSVGKKYQGIKDDSIKSGTKHKIMLLHYSPKDIDNGEETNLSIGTDNVLWLDCLNDPHLADEEAGGQEAED